MSELKFWIGGNSLTVGETIGMAKSKLTMFVLVLIQILQTVWVALVKIC